MCVCVYTTGMLSDCTNRLTTNLSTFEHRCNMNKLTLNVKKRKYTIFYLRSKTRHIGNHTLSIDDIKIDRVPSYKYLGLTFDVKDRQQEVRAVLVASRYIEDYRSLHQIAITQSFHVELRFRS